MLQICNNIINVFRADGKTNRSRPNSDSKQLFFAQLRVGCRCRMYDKALDIGNICQKREQLQTFGKLLGILRASLDIKGKNGAGSLGEIAVIEFLFSA